MIIHYDSQIGYGSASQAEGTFENGQRLHE